MFRVIRVVDVVDVSVRNVMHWRKYVTMEIARETCVEIVYCWKKRKGMIL